MLHTVVEAEAAVSPSPESDEAVLPSVIDFLDHFDASLDVVVGCARKTEVDRWPHLFDIVGNPKALFEVGSTARTTFCVQKNANDKCVCEGMHAGRKIEDRWLLPPRPPYPGATGF